MIAVLYHIAKQNRGGVHIVQHHVDVAIIKKVPEGGAAGGNHVGQATTRRRRDFLKLGAVKIAKKLRTLRPGRAPVPSVDRRVDVSVCYEDVQQAVIVKVDEPDPPTQKRNGWRCPSLPGR